MLSAAARLALITCLVGATPLLARAATNAGYDTAELAFQSAFIESGVGQRGYIENREYAAALYQMPNGRWYATRIVAGDRTRSLIPYDLVPDQAVRIAGAHSHGQPRLPEDPARIYGTDFSQTDRLNAVRAYQMSHGRIDSQLLLTSLLQVLHMSVALGYDPAAARIQVMARTWHVADEVDRHESVTVEGETSPLSRGELQAAPAHSSPGDETPLRHASDVPDSSDCGIDRGNAARWTDGIER